MSTCRLVLGMLRLLSCSQLVPSLLDHVASMHGRLPAPCCQKVIPHVCCAHCCTLLLAILLCSVPVTLLPSVSEAWCPSLAYLQPNLAFSTSDVWPSLSLPGLLLGARTSNTSTGGVSLLQQSTVAVLNSAMPASGHQLLAHVGSTSAATGSIKLPGSAGLTVRP